MVHSYLQTMVYARNGRPTSYKGVSIVLSGEFTLTPGSGGLRASPEPFNFNLVWHLPGS
jgi:hypothetical protein